MTTRIYISLLNEGIPVSRPAVGELVSEGIYRVLQTDDYDPELEEWEFPPGTVVRCETEIENGREIRRAVERVVE